VDDYIGLAIPTAWAQLDHVANSMMYAIHDVFPPDPVDENYPISFKKFRKLDCSWDTIKEILRFIFNGDEKTMWSLEGKQDALIVNLKGWLRVTNKQQVWHPIRGVPINPLQGQTCFHSNPMGIISPFYNILGWELLVVFLRRNKALGSEIQECCISCVGRLQLPCHAVI
jgi:hypothetical protein